MFPCRNYSEVEVVSSIAKHHKVEIKAFNTAAQTGLLYAQRILLQRVFLIARIDFLNGLSNLSSDLIRYLNLRSQRESMNNHRT